MNRRLPYLLSFFSLFLLSIQSFSQVGIGTTTPDASAILDVNSSDKGFLPPRMTETQRDDIGSPGKPATGLMIYNTTTNVINCYDGTSWGTLEEYLDLTNNQTLESGVKTFSNDIYPTGKILMPMGEVNYFNITGTNQVISAQYSTDADLVPINVASSVNSIHEFDNGGANDGSLRYIGETTKMFHIAATISGNKAGGNNNEIYLFTLAINGSVQSRGRVIGDMTGVQATAFHVMLMLNKNDTLRFYVGNTSGTEDFICYSLNLFAWGM